MATDQSAFVPALIVVDVQNDFCPPDGALAVQGGRDIAPLINHLLYLPFRLKIATRDWHPQSHISFASNHSPPNNKPFESYIDIANPHNKDEIESTRLWPDHCVQGTHGAELIAELDISRFDHVVDKGQNDRVEMYSAFAAPFTNPPVAVSGLAEKLRDAGITHVYTVGLAYDYCVKCTAVDAAKEGFTTYFISDACRAVDGSEDNVKKIDDHLRSKNVHVIRSDGPELARVKG